MKAGWLMKDAKDAIDYQQLLENHPFFATWPKEVLKSLAKKLDFIYFEPGKTIVAQGDIVDCIYFITHGKVEVSCKNEAGENNIVATLGPGETIGLSESGMFAPHGIRTATISALTNVMTLRLGITEFDNILRVHPSFKHHIQGSFDELLKMDLIKHVAPFISLSSETIQEVVSKIVAISKSANQYIFRENDNGDYCYIIRSGTISIERKDKKGNTQNLAILESPQIFGETSLLMTTKRNANARTMTNCELYALPKSVFFDMVTKEHKSIESLTLLILERADPQCNPVIISSKTSSSADEEILVLKNQTNHEYLQLRSYGIRLWELLKNEHPIREILDIINEEYGNVPIEDIMDLVFLLARDDFVFLQGLGKR